MEVKVDPVSALFDVDMALRFLSHATKDEYTQVMLRMVREKHRKAIMVLNDLEYAPQKK